MSKVAPPLGNLTRSEQPTGKLPKPTFKTDALADNITKAQTNAPIRGPKVAPIPTYSKSSTPPLPPAQSNTLPPANKELVFSAPGVSNTPYPPSEQRVSNAIPQAMDFSKVGGAAGDALASYATQRNDSVPIPMMTTLDSTPDMPVSDLTISQLAGDESTPFNYSGVGAGAVGTNSVVTKPVEGIARYNGNFDNVVVDPTKAFGSSAIVIANSRPIQQYQYTEGLTQSQRNSRNFFNGLQEFRQQLAPVQLPAIQFTPQQLNPGVAGGFSPTAETKGPLSWLVDGQQKDFNPLKLEFGGQGGGLLGGVGWLFSRLSPTTYLKGAAMDVSRSAASLIEGGSAALTELFKSGDFGKAYNEGLDAAWENYDANAPVKRGMTQQTFFGNKGLGDFFGSSYTTAAATGMIDLSFSGTGNNPLLTGDASYGVVNKGDNFNPFGLRDPIRSGFNTGALEAQERAKSMEAWNANPYRTLPGNPLHGYDQWIRGGVGLLGDIFLENRIDKTALGAIKKLNPPKVTRDPQALQDGITALRSPANNPARYIPSPPGTLVKVATELPPLRDIKDISEFLPKQAPTKPGALVKSTPTAKPNGITQVVDGEFVESASDILVRNRRNAPQYTDPIRNRYLPQGSDPFSVSSSRAYVPEAGISGVSLEAGGALVPYTGKESRIVPAVLGVGSKPGSIPVNTTGKLSKTGTSVTTWDDTTQSFISTGRVTSKSLPTSSPVKAPLDELDTNTPVAPLTRPVEPLSSLSEGSVIVDLPVVVPRNTPNFTVKPTAPPVDLLDTHTVNPVTGVFNDTVELAGVNARKLELTTTKGDVTPPTELPTPVAVPAKQIEYITAEAISPSVSSADIVRRLTSGADIPGAVYNPRQVERQARSIQSVVSLARQVTLPNGVRILDDLVKDTSVMKWDRIAKKVETAIVASGLNPGSSEAQSIRRLFDRFGKPLPENLSPDFSIEVAGRSVTSPASYVKPATQVVDGNVTWTGRAARYTPTYELSSDYAIGVKVKYDDDLKRIVPVDGQDMKLSPAVRTEQVPVTRSQMLDLSVHERQALISKSFKDGYEVPQKAIDDAITPDIMTDALAAKSYAQANLPKDSVPLRMDREARQILSEHSDLVREASYTRDAITDVSTQLTDVERQLNKYLKKIDELPDIGVEPLVDDVPFSPLPKLNPEDLPPVTGQSKVISESQLYHGTRVQDLVLNGVDPLQGAARSEYGTGVWLTKSQEIATAAAGRSVPANSVPNVNRTFGDSAYIHELPGNALDSMNIPRATDTPPAKVINGLLEQLDNNRFVFSDVVPYGDDLTDELVNLFESGKVKSYSELFSKVDDLTHKTAKRNLGTKPDEYELTYVQRVVTDMLKGTGVQGLTNDVNTVIYDTRMLTAKYVHDVTDIVGDATSEVTTALHNVNLLQKSLDAEPTSQLLRVQLAEAKAVAASKIRDSLSDELDTLSQLQSKQISDLLNKDDAVAQLTRKQRSEEMIRATTKDEATIDSFSKELNRSDWTGPCL